MIAEEAGETNTPVSRPTSAVLLGGAHQIPRKPSPVGTPSPHQSPARSPAIAPQMHVPEPEAAQLSTLSPASRGVMEGGLDGPSPTYATREADIASAMKASPENATPELSQAEKESQKAFLESHHAQLPMDDVPRSRSESPSKGRVQQLAGKFGEVSHSRRGSTQSNASKHSIQSWERSQENSRPSSPTKPASPTKDGVNTRPAAGREASFRPKLPGQWDSYATTAATPPEPGKELGSDGLPESKVASPLAEVDLTPTTTKHPVLTAEPSKSSRDPLSALKAAGAAVGEAIQASVGRRPSAGEEQVRDAPHGDVIPRPLQLERTASSVSSIPPTPPAKDTPESEVLPPVPPLKESSPEPNPTLVPQPNAARPGILPQLSTDPSADDQESDRLRKEIVASLGPSGPSVPQTHQPDRTSLQPGEPAANRESSIFPSEYDSYWADGDRTSPRPSHDLARNAPDLARPEAEPSAVATRPTDQPSDGPGKPSLLTRFSWEDQGSHLLTPDRQTQAGAGPQAPKSSTEEGKLPSLATGQSVTKDSDRSLEGIAEPYFGPVHTVASPISDPDQKARAPSPTTETAKPVESPTTEHPRGASPASGLHVVNSDVNPEAVDIPPRLSREVSPASAPIVSQESPAATHEHKVSEPAAVSPLVPEPTSSGVPSAQEPVALSPTDKPRDMRDIMTIKSSAERISACNKSREYWAHADHGLNDWVASVVAANPDLANQSYPQPRPALPTSSTPRHRATGSISLFGKHHGASSHKTEQNTAPSSQAPLAPASTPTAGGKSAGHQMQAKGKDLLHTAGVLGGKGMTGAKGLFAKGKSRFKGDKVDK